MEQAAKIGGLVVIVAFLCVTAANANADEPPPGWIFSSGEMFPGATGSLDADAEGVLHLRYDFAGGGAYVGAYKALDPLQALKSVSFRVKKPAEAQITLRVIDSTDQGLQKRLSYDHGQWQQVEVELYGFDQHFSGANDGVVHHPVKSVGFLLERIGLELPAGEIQLRDVAFHAAEAGAPPAEFHGTYQVTDFGNDSGFFASDSSANRSRAWAGYGAVDSGALKDGVWRIDFGKNDAATLYHSLTLFGNPRRVTLKLRGGEPGNVVTMILASHYQAFHRELGTIDGPETAFTVDLPPGNGWKHAGGENDGKLHAPLSLSAIEIARGDGQAQPVEVDPVELTCETVVPRKKAVIGVPSLRGLSDSTLEAGCVMRNLLVVPLSGTMTITLNDWERKGDFCHFCHWEQYTHRIPIL